MESAVVANFGDGEVYVSHLLLTMPGRDRDWQARRFIFEERLPAGQFMRREALKIEQVNGIFVRGLKGEEFEDLVRKAANNDSCFTLVFFHLPTRPFANFDKWPGQHLTFSKSEDTWNIGG